MFRRALLAVLAGALVLAACSSPDDEAPPVDPPEAPDAVDEPDVPEEPEGPIGPPSPLTGEPVLEELLDQPLLLVKIENTPQARPQTGLDHADVVIEEVVEFGITRFMVLFHSELPEIAGPIRSARPVDVDLVSAFGRSVFAYSGARAEVQALLSPTPVIRMADDAGDDSFFRATERRAPHNLYLRPAQALEVAAIRDPEPVPDIGFVFSDEPPAGEDVCPVGAADCDDPGAAITVNMSSTYLSGWEYDATDGVYRRLQNGQPFATSVPGQVGMSTADREVGAANVVLLGTRHYIGPSGYPETDATTPVAGERAVILRDGRRYEARWVKAAQSDHIALQTVDGQPFPLKPGKTWLHLPSTTSLPAPIG
ncbi:MAG: DUF3048 domain-containing protein [Nitriliruptoraceae bacterium]